MGRSRYPSSDPGPDLSISMDLPASPKLLMAVTGPLIGVGAGIVLGFVAWIVGRFIRKPDRVERTAS